MRKKLRKELASCFTRELGNLLPQFQPHTEESDSPIWAWNVASNLTFFVMLQTLNKKDQFVLEIGWSENGQYPWEMLPSHPPRLDAPGFRERLSQLWATGPVAEPWALVADETDEERQEKIRALEQGEVKKWLQQPSEQEVLPRVAPLVADSLQKLVEFGMPVFKSVAERRGITADKLLTAQEVSKSKSDKQAPKKRQSRGE